jgi:pimeloyl-ACP methyl ester carboxylesterase
MRIVLLLLALSFAPAQAADHLVSVDTRPGVKMTYWLMQRPGAPLTVLLIPGGGGGIALRDGVPQSKNFLIRSRDYFAQAGYNVALLGKSSDRADMDPWWRKTDEHVTDVRVVVEKLRHDLKVPVWLVGTSNGTISAAAAGAAIDPSMLGGIVLTSSIVVGDRFSPVQGLDIEKIRVPVLVVHHRHDACKSCTPGSVDSLMSGLRNAPVKKLVWIDGGGPATGETCEALHWHGFIGKEKETVDTITAWIRQPAP